jgi:hypothetical protein
MAMKNWSPAKGREKGLADDPRLVFLDADDPTETPDLVVFVGIVGKSPRQNHWRIYLNYALSEFIEVHEEQVQVALTTDDEWTRVWVQAGARVRHVSQRASTAEQLWSAPKSPISWPRSTGDAEFLQGPIAARWGERIATASAEGDGGPVGSGCRCVPWC